MHASNLSSPIHPKNLKEHSPPSRMIFPEAPFAKMREGYLVFLHFSLTAQMLVHDTTCP